MYVIGIVSSPLLGGGRFVRAEYQPCLYRARQQKNGRWSWEKVRLLGEAPTNFNAAEHLAHAFARDNFGDCRVYDHGLGNRYIL